nr:myb/SANT-like DNA-binding domain-containing protein 4 [Penaeus vannamei]
MSSVSKKRRPNFTHDELMALIANVQLHQEILEGPLTATVTHQMKLRAWEEVTAVVNATGKTLRSPEEVKLKYIDFKSHTKKLNFRKKLGGPSIAPPLTPAEEAMAQLINPAVVYGISDSLQSESAEAVAEITAVYVEEDERLSPITAEPVTETPVHSRPSSRSSGTAQQPLSARMLEVQEGILDEVRGIRNALEGQTTALQNINATLLEFTSILRTIKKP